MKFVLLGTAICPDRGLADHRRLCALCSEAASTSLYLRPPVVPRIPLLMLAQRPETRQTLRLFPGAPRLIWAIITLTPPGYRSRMVVRDDFYARSGVSVFQEKAGSLDASFRIRRR